MTARLRRALLELTPGACLPTDVPREPGHVLFLATWEGSDGRDDGGVLAVPEADYQEGTTDEDGEAVEPWHHAIVVVDDGVPLFVQWVTS